MTIRPNEITKLKACQNLVFSILEKIAKSNVHQYFIVFTVLYCKLAVCVHYHMAPNFQDAHLCRLAFLKPLQKQFHGSRSMVPINGIGQENFVELNFHSS